MQGQLGEKLIADLIREIAQKNSSGLLRLSRGKTIKAIFFESGAPVFAISNLTNEQFDHKVIQDGLATHEQVERARQAAGKANRTGPVLVEMGVISEADMRRLMREQVMLIIASLFEWTQGDYAFDERIRAAHDVTLQVSTADLILEGMRRAARMPQIADLVAPLDATVYRAKSNGIRLDLGSLLPVEGYVLSRIEGPTLVGEVGALSGLADDDARRAVCALVASGFLKQQAAADKEAQAAESEPAADDALERLRDEVMRKLHFFSTADFYDILGVNRHATTAEVKTAYYQMAKKFHPDRYRQPEHADLRSKLETLFALATQAYDTLTEPAQRAAYDERIRKNPASARSEPLKTTPLANVEVPAAEPPRPAEEHAPSSELNAPASQSSSGGLYQQGGSEKPAPAAQAAHAPAGGNPAVMAEQYYHQGRARYDRKEYHAAVHLLREAVRLDPSRAPYHFHLGIALIRNPRTRREAEEHLTKAAELDPYNAQIRVKMGLIYKEAGLANKAQKYFREALQLDPDNRVAKREAAGEGAKPEHASIWKSDFGSLAKRIFKK